MRKRGRYKASRREVDVRENKIGDEPISYLGVWKGKMGRIRNDQRDPKGQPVKIDYSGEKSQRVHTKRGRGEKM